MRFFNDLKNARKNFKIVQTSPYGSLVLKYRTTLIGIVLLSIFVGFTIIKLVLSNTTPGVMGWVSRIFPILIYIYFIYKAYHTIDPIKRAMAPYEKNKDLVDHTDTDAKVEILNILDQFDENGKRRDDVHLEKNELNSKKEVAPVLPR